MAQLKRRSRRWRRAAAREDGASALVIAAVIAAVAFTAVSGMLLTLTTNEVNRSRQGITNLSRVYDAIVVAAIRDQDGAENEDHYLPCPADPTATTGFGTSVDRTGDVCDLQRGIVPFIDLGLSQQDARDGYGNYIAYVVDGTDTSLCVGDQPNAGTVEDLRDSSTNHLFALISHGRNGAGGYNGPNSSNATEPSAVEAANCGVACGGADDNQIRSGPHNETEGDDYFDDMVKLAVAGDFTRDCEIFDEEDINIPEGAQMSLNTRERAVLYSEGANSGTDGQASVEAVGGGDENYTDPDTGETYYRIRFDNINNAATASCFFNDSAFLLRDSTVRAYMEFAARSEVNDTPAVPNGNGGILAFMSYDPGTYLLANTTCGGTDQYMGFADQPSNPIRQLPNVPRIGVEVDTHSHNGSDGNQDPPENHVAIINRNNNHAGTDVSVDGPICIDGVAGLGDADPGNVNGSTDLQGCRVDAPAGSVDATNWLEIGTVNVDGDIEPQHFHRMRVELHQYTGACPTADEVRVDLWVYPNAGGSFPTCPADADDASVDCRNLNHDYTAVEAPHYFHCLPWSGDSADDYIRFGFTSGARAVNNSNGEDWFTIQSFGLNSVRHNPTPAPLAATDERSVEITNVSLAQSYANTYGLATLNNTVDSALALLDVPGSGDYFGATLLAKFGTFTLNYANTGNSTPEELYDAQGLGVVGIGNADNNAVDDYWDGATYPRTIGNKEGIEVRFPRSVSRVTMALGDFGVESSGRTERMRVISYAADEQVSNTLVSSCNTGNNQNMVLSLDYSIAPIDRILIEPQTVAALPGGTVTNTYGSGFWLQGLKACGLDGSCGLTIEHDCYQYNGDFPYGGRGAPSATRSGMVTAYTIDDAINDGAPSPMIRFDDAGETPWVSLDFEVTGATDPDDDGPVAVDIFGSGTNTSDIHIENNGTPIQDGFAVHNEQLQTANSETLDLRFANTWRRVALAFGRFGQTNNNNANDERAIIRGYRNGAQVGADYTFTACTPTVGTSGDIASGNLTLEWGSDIDQVTITPLTTSLGAATQFVVRGFRACSDGVTCEITGTYAGADCAESGTVP